MDSCAPVLIPTLNRHVHFKRCVKSLAACMHAEKTDLYIALDYPLQESHWEGYRIIKEDIIPSIQGFKSVNVIERDRNFGARKNIADARNTIFENYDRMIFSEDDNEFSTDFLNFVNQGLQVYKDRPDIFAVTGYNYPIEMPESYTKEAYLWQGYSAWGVGIWREKFRSVVWDEEAALKIIEGFLKKYFLCYKQFKIANYFLHSNISMSNNKMINGDSYLSLYLFMNHMFALFPKITRVRNTGHDGSGVHCRNLKSKKFLKQKLYIGTSNYVLEKNISSDKKINRVLYNYFSVSSTRKLKLFTKLVLRNIFS